MHGVQLAESAVQQNHIRAVGIAHPLKAPGQDFFHHGKVIIGDIGIFDVKRPILFLVKAIGGGDNHGPYPRNCPEYASCHRPQSAAVSEED